MNNFKISPIMEYHAAPALNKRPIAKEKKPGMTEEQITLVKNSWKMFQKVDAGLIGDVFYSKLFCDNPQLRSMFPFSMKQQHKKLIDMLSVIIAKLDDLSEITADIKIMARRHEGYGVKPQHYRLAGNALIWTLKRGLGGDWNDDLEKAWMAAYTKLAEAMIAAARQS
jgi:hemoglobin-like flavoprotein